MHDSAVMQARSGDGAFLARLDGAAFAGVVLSAFHRAVNITCLSSGELHTLVTGDLDDGPNSLVVATPDFLRAGIAPGDPVRAGAGRLAIAGKAVVSTAGAVLWRMPRPVARVDEATLRRRLAAAEGQIWRDGKPGGLLPDVAGGEIAQVTARMLHEAVDGVTAALGRGDETEALRHAARLLGLGPGLTPSGDDVLLGILAARALRRGIPEDAFARGVSVLARTATNPISHAALAKAARGEVRDGIARLLVALCEPQGEALPAALARVLAIGSSSGTEIAFGVIRGLASIIDNGEWDHGHQDRD